MCEVFVGEVPGPAEGCSGICVLQGSCSWGAHEAGVVALPNWPEPGESLRVAYDDRGAPFAVDACGAEQPDLLLSLADDDDFVAAAWACVQKGGGLLGLGVDLVSIDAFGDDERGRKFAKLLLTEHEHALVAACPPEQRAFAKAALFGAKEAAFKACAAPLRRWYDAHDEHAERLAFEVRHFSAPEWGSERGEERNAAAQRAMDKMGITRIAWQAENLGTHALVTALALGPGASTLGVS